MILFYFILGNLAASTSLLTGNIVDILGCFHQWFLHESPFTSHQWPVAGESNSKRRIVASAAESPVAKIQH